MAATPRGSNGSHTDVTGESSEQRAEGEGTVENIAVGSRRGQHGRWREIAADSQLLHTMKTSSELPSPNPTTLQLLYSLVQLQGVAISMMEYLILG